MYMTEIKYTNTKGRYKLPDKNRTTVAISLETHSAIKMYAQRRNLVLEKATEELLQLALTKIYRKKEA